MVSELDVHIERRGTGSIKWSRYPADVIPLWVADMDFAAPRPVLDALRRHVDHGVFGYGTNAAELTEVFIEHVSRRYAWSISPEDVLLLDGVVPGIHMACRGLAGGGEKVLVQTPVYPPIRTLPAECDRSRVELGLARAPDGRYEVDWDAFEAAVADRVRMFILCNPQNPTGRVFSRGELERFAAVCVRHDTVIVSDEIHCDILWSGHQHIPIASLDPEVASRTVTLMSPSKTYNLAGLQCAFAVITNRELRHRFRASWQGLVPHVNVLGTVAAMAAYREGQEWLNLVRAYLQENRDRVCQVVRDRMPGVTVSAPDGTYLAWLDCRNSPAGANPHAFFLERARVAISGGEAFGSDGVGFARLNFGCTKATLEEALERMASSLMGPLP
jgi:cystathionine beta-lyase